MANLQLHSLSKSTLKGFAVTTFIWWLLLHFPSTDAIITCEAEGNWPFILKGFHKCKGLTFHQFSSELLSLVFPGLIVAAMIVTKQILRKNKGA